MVPLFLWRYVLDVLYVQGLEHIYEGSDFRPCLMLLFCVEISHPLIIISHLNTFHGSC